MDLVFVIARWKEDVSWADSIPNKFIVQKDIHLPNIGREASSYLWYIINHYNILPEIVCFRQGRVHDTPVNLFNHYCSHDGCPHHIGLDIKSFADRINLPIPDTLNFTPGAQLDVERDKIRERPLSWYQHAYDVVMSNQIPTVPWLMERLWKYIFNL